MPTTSKGGYFGYRKPLLSRISIWYKTVGLRCLDQLESVVEPSVNAALRGSSVAVAT